MIQKLRKRFILIMMSMVSIILIVTFSVLVISSAQQLREESFQDLEEEYERSISNNENTLVEKSNASDNHKNDLFDERSNFSTFYITLDEESEIVSVDDNNSGVESEDAQAAVSAALTQNAMRGTVDSMSLRYMLFETTSSERVIGFIDISFEQNFIREQIISYTLIGLGSIAAFFVISLILSKIAIKPVDRAWKKQQQFITDASHELKTPIAVMLANASILLSGKDLSESETKKWLSHIDSEAHHMKKLVEDFAIPRTRRCKRQRHPADAYRSFGYSTAKFAAI